MIEFTDTFVTLQFSLYLLISCILLCYCIRHTYIVVYDTIYLVIDYAYSYNYHGTYPRVNKKLKQILHHLNPQFEKKENCVKRCRGELSFIYDFYENYIAPYYYIDSKWYLLSMGIKELIEIAVQLYGLLLYVVLIYLIQV